MIQLAAVATGCSIFWRSCRIGELYPSRHDELTTRSSSSPDSWILSARAKTCTAKRGGIALPICWPMSEPDQGKSCGKV